MTRLTEGKVAQPQEGVSSMEVLPRKTRTMVSFGAVGTQMWDRLRNRKSGRV